MHSHLRSGHAPAHLRDAFLEALERKDLPAAQELAGDLWGCTDTVPRSWYDELDFPPNRYRRSYAAVARLIRHARRWFDWPRS